MVGEGGTFRGSLRLAALFFEYIEARRSHLYILPFRMSGGLGRIRATAPAVRHGSRRGQSLFCLFCEEDHDRHSILMR
jgi:hypothetical protein